MNKRPKSREETPKEGSDSARRYRTATICGRAAQNARVFETFSAVSRQGWRLCNTSTQRIYLCYFNMLRDFPHGASRCLAATIHKNPDFVIDAHTKNTRLSEPESKAGDDR